MILRSPVVVAAGPWSSGEEDCAPLAAAAAIVAKTVTAAPRPGNPPPVLQPLADRAGYLNRIGLRNVGAADFVRSRLPALFAAGPPIIQSFTGQSEAEVEQILSALEPQPLAGYELNASCPNAPDGQLAGETLRQVLRRARALTRRPIWVKLSYAAAPLLLDQARICADEGADALTAINTLPALAIDIATQPLTAGRSFVGGLSGPSLTPLAQWAVDLLHRQQPLPVIACGGVSSLRQLLSFVALGAAAVQVGSALLDDPQLCGRLDAELQAMLRDNQLSDFSQLAEVLCLPSTS